MRILHTSDWHLGRSLEGRDRIEEQQKFIVEICDIADQEQVDLVLIAGDIFDTSNPSAKAEQLFYQGLYDLTQGGRRGVVVIAGNHDNPERLRASNPLADQMGITLIGLPKDNIYTGFSKNRVKTVASGIGWLEIAIDSCEHHAVIIALPYPSEQRLREMFVESLDEEAMQRSYSQRVGGFLEERVQHFRKDTVNLCTSHLFVRGSKESDSERPIQLGGACTVDKEMLPLEAQYIALGHLHRPQRVGSHGNIRYSGSPLAYSFSEVGHSKSVYLVECLPGAEALVREIPLTSGRPLVKWDAPGGLAQVFKWCEDNRDVEAWIDLSIHVQEPLQAQEIKKLREIRPGIIHIRPILPEMDRVLKLENRINLPVEKIFRQFYYKTYSTEPNEDLVKLFLQLLEDEEEEIS